MLWSATESKEAFIRVHRNISNGNKFSRFFIVSKVIGRDDDSRNERNKQSNLLT